MAFKQAGHSAGDFCGVKPGRLRERVTEELKAARHQWARGVGIQGDTANWKLSFQKAWIGGHSWGVTAVMENPSASSSFLPLALDHPAVHHTGCWGPEIKGE